jgi:hypothetical protein
MLTNEGRTEEGVLMLREVLDMQKEVLGPTHPNTLNLMEDLEYLYVKQGSMSEAISLKRQLVHAELELRPKEPSTAKKMYEFAAALWNSSTNLSDERMEAREVMRQALALAREVLGDEDPHSLHFAGMLADMEAQQHQRPGEDAT